MTEAGPRLPTLGDVAALAGVSVSTASNVVRGSDVVAAPTRMKVVAAVAQLGYRPNRLARQLLRGRAQLIGIIAHDLGNPFLAEIASIVEREAARFGYGAMFCTTEGDPVREATAVTLMLENRVAGIAFVSYLSRAEVIGELIGGQAATMFIAAMEPWSDSVSVDERRGGEIVAAHLLGLGHRRLAFVRPSHPDTADLLRLDGFARPVADAGGEVTVIEWDAPDGPVIVDGAVSSWEAVFRAERQRTGVFASNDFTAMDLIDVADSLGVRVPRDLSVVGFDDIPAAALRRINLTTVHQPRRELVRLGIEGMIGRIEGRISGPPLLTLAGVALRTRGTTGPLAGRRESRRGRTLPSA
jgi:LacI family transcriptional regulator